MAGDVMVWRDAYKSLLQQLTDLEKEAACVQVFCRTRPPADEAASSICEITSQSNQIAILDPGRRGTSSRRTYSFDRVFDPSASGSQEDVFGSVRTACGAVLRGRSLCVFAYGMTGAGKTHTMTGTSEEPGLTPRALDFIFQEIDAARRRSPDIKIRASVSVLEVYCEQIRNLLDDIPTTEARGPHGTADGGASSSSGLRNRTQNTTIPEWTEVEVQDAKEALQLMQKGSSRRAVEATLCNANSSRSHCLSCLTVTVEEGSEGPKTGRLALVDLAGSERMYKSGVDGRALKEGAYINRSISALGDVIEAVASKQPHVPFRNSKLTLLLQDLLTHSARLVMIVHVSTRPEDYHETLHSLQWASRFKGADFGAVGVRARRDEAEITKLRAALAKANEEIQTLQAAAEQLQERAKDRAGSQDRLAAALRELEGLRESKARLEQELRRASETLAAQEKELEDQRALIARLQSTQDNDNMPPPSRIPFAPSLPRPAKRRQDTPFPHRRVARKRAEHLDNHHDGHQHHHPKLEDGPVPFRTMMDIDKDVGRDGDAGQVETGEGGQEGDEGIPQAFGSRKLGFSPPPRKRDVRDDAEDDDHQDNDMAAPIDTTPPQEIHALEQVQHELAQEGAGEGDGEGAEADKGEWAEEGNRVSRLRRSPVYNVYRDRRLRSCMKRGIPFGKRPKRSQKTVRQLLGLSPIPNAMDITPPKAVTFNEQVEVFEPPPLPSPEPTPPPQAPPQAAAGRGRGNRRGALVRRPPTPLRPARPRRQAGQRGRGRGM
ncbi:unnamed protein product [Vitrella brassicaformis CCMP3155]|uniref:Kinesin-like protein n=4 Tax=Vitrella brassicaformis TaxID=1169539 RepID=A0A0G4GVU4_VITBC|nr:unnamed protein product [Vitrella brassicaformis CCMP3155]|eukprot:CEM35002.1 unnamed protein product [Vitrella brassicaformis CCMP3155]